MATPAELFDLTEALVVRMGDDLQRGLQQLGLTPARATVVWELQRRGPITQRALATHLEVTPRNVTGLVDALVRTGFVTREPHPTDRRAIFVTLTDHGRGIGAGLVTGHASLAGQLFDGLPAEVREGFRIAVTHVLEQFTALQAAENPRADSPDRDHPDRDRDDRDHIDGDPADRDQPTGGPS